MKTRFCVILTTYTKKVTGEKISRALLSGRLAACIQVFPATALYTWKGREVRGRERVMLIKSRASDFRRIEAAIRAVHDYEVPEIISLGIERGSEGYLNWLGKETR
jgi:periplasmic divalent cation tolerance protein